MMEDEEEFIYSDDEFYATDSEMMQPLINWTMKEDAKSSDPNEQSNLVAKKSITIQDDALHSVDVTDIVGKSGLWQIKILVLTLLMGMPTAWNHLGMTFLAKPVDHWCGRPYGINMSVESWYAEFLPNKTIKGKMQHSQCDMYLFNETSESVIKNRAVPCDSYEYAADYNSIVMKWNLVCNEEWMLSTSQTVYMIGFLVAVLISGHFADKFGRHPTIMMNILILIAAGFAVAFSSSFIMFTICRFFVAIGHGGVGLVTYILLIETIGAEYRVKYMFLQGLGWHVGFTVLPLIAWMIEDWFVLQLIITVPSIFFLSYFWLLPESPRWLLANGRLKKALPILENAAKMNGLEIKDLEGQAKKIADLNSKGKQNQAMTTVFDLLRTPNLRMKTLCLYFIWAVIAFTYYGLSLNTNDLEGNEYVNFFISGFIEIPSTIFCMLTLNRFGRKKPFIITLLVGGLACFACIFIPDRFSMVKTGLAMTGKAFITGSFSIVYIFSAETFPTVARNVGVGSSSTIARIGSSIAPFMRDLGNVTNPSVPLVIFGVLSIISSLIVLKIPETNNQPIPESIDQAENFGKKESLDVSGSYNAEKSP